MKAASDAKTDALTRYFESHEDRFVEDLKAALRIPSVSTQAKHDADVRRCAEHLAAHLRELGMNKVEVANTPGHPIVVAEWTGAPGKPTALVYGHYDVQPPEPLSLWKSPPFEPIVRDGKLFARGAVDDKGQVYMHLKAIEGHMKVHGRLPLNLKMIIEGEEESGSESLAPFLESRREQLACDVIVVSDTAMMNESTPALTYGLRGILYTEIHVTGPAHDLHSGHFGGTITNPGNALCSIIAALKDDDGRITIPGFYDKIREPEPEELARMKALPFDEARFLRETGASEFAGERGFGTFERVWFRPTLDVNGMWGGYQEKGSKTVLPSTFGAKVSMRLVPDQDPDEIFEAMKPYVERLAPPGVRLEVKKLHIGLPFITDPDSPVLQAARRALARVWPDPPVMIREGGSVPVMAHMQRIFGVPFVLMGFGLDDDNVHAPNEKFNLSCYRGGIRSVACLYEELAAL